MNIFPLLGNINETISGVIESRAGQNLTVSKLIPWIRVASAVNGGLILQSVFKTTFEETYGDNAKSGLVGLDFNGNPVYAANSDRGLRPSPIIESANIQNGHLGLSRKATFDIKCFTLGQAEKIAQHFLEPGFTVLVEFGWNTPDGVRDLKDALNPCEMAKFNSYSHVMNKRLDSNGNYDGFLGFITGGGLTYGDGETYIVSVELTTVGEIPAYLQTHRGATGPAPANDEEETGKKFEIYEIKGQSDIGKKLFMQMYNRLPAQKRTDAVKSLIVKTDYSDVSWASQENFINVDTDVRKLVSENIGKISVSVGGENKEVNVPDGIRLFTDQSYIRVELAFAILNTYSFNLKPQASKCSGVSTYSYVIDINNTVLRAHKYMFSLDPTKLYIPNTNLPTFGLKHILTAIKEVELGNIIDFKNGFEVFNGNPWTEDIGLYSFPCIENFNNVANMRFPANTNVIEADPYTWGYLRNLYINLDFFIDVLERANYVTKDVYYELLNGISDAANSYWHFEIVEAPDRTPTGKSVNAGKLSDPSKTKDEDFPMVMTVADLSFTGKVPKVKETRFDALGTQTPFLSFNIDMTIPAVMRNSILGKRSAQQINPVIDGQNSEIRSFFGGGDDPVMEYINSFKPLSPSELAAADDKRIREKILQEKKDFAARNSIWGSTPSEFNVINDEVEGRKKLEKANLLSKITPEEAQKANLEAFAEMGTLLILADSKKSLMPSVDTNYFSKDSIIFADDNPIFIISAYNDPLLLKKVERYFLNDKYIDITNSNKELNPMILGPEVTFTIHGVSGLRVGDLFYLNKLPAGYTDKPFQIMEIEQQLSGNQWITSVKAKMRNI